VHVVLILDIVVGPFVLNNYFLTRYFHDVVCKEQAIYHLFTLNMCRKHAKFKQRCFHFLCRVVDWSRV